MLIEVVYRGFHNGATGFYFSSNLPFYLRLEMDNCARQRQNTIIDEMAVKVDAFNTLFDEKRAAYVTTDRPLDGIFMVC